MKCVGLNGKVVGVLGICLILLGDVKCVGWICVDVFGLWLL